MVTLACVIGKTRQKRKIKTKQHQGVGEKKMIAVATDAFIRCIKYHQINHLR